MLGLISSLITAWAAAIFGPVNPPPTGPAARIAGECPQPGMMWEGTRAASLGRVQWRYRPQPESPGPALRLPRWAPTPDYATTAEFNGYGWPLVCLTAWKDTQRGHSFVVIQGWSASSGDIWVPATPAWGGLLANAAFWAAAWWAVLAGPAWFRRWRRAARGVCVRCGYDLRGIAGACPECGHERSPVTRRGS